MQYKFITMSEIAHTLPKNMDTDFFLRLQSTWRFGGGGGLGGGGGGGVGGGR